MPLYASNIGLSRKRLAGPPILRDEQLPADTLKARDLLITSLRGDDLDEQRKDFEELCRLKLRDIARAEAAVVTRRSSEAVETSWARVEVPHLWREL